jgi:hypothetical protein
MAMMYGNRTQGIELVIVSFITLTLAGWGCANNSKSKKDKQGELAGELAGAPDWVKKGCASYWENKEDRRICGVGSVNNTGSMSMARSAAKSRARSSIARTLQTRVESMLKDYQANTAQGDEFQDEQKIVNVSKQVTDVSLSGTRQVQSWMSNSGTFYVMMAMDLSNFQSALDQMNDLSDDVRKAVSKRAEKNWNELDEETSEDSK